MTDPATVDVTPVDALAEKEVVAVLFEVAPPSETVAAEPPSIELEVAAPETEDYAVAVELAPPVTEVVTVDPLIAEVLGAVKPGADQLTAPDLACSLPLTAAVATLAPAELALVNSVALTLVAPAALDSDVALVAACVISLVAASLEPPALASSKASVRSAAIFFLSASSSY